MQTLTMTFLRPAVSGETVYFYYYGLYPSNLTPFLRSEACYPARNFPGQFKTGTTATDQAQIYYSAFTADYGNVFNSSISGATITIEAQNGSPIFNASTGLQPPFSQLISYSAATTGSTVNLLDSVQDIRVRSSNLLISTGTTATTFTQSNFTIRTFEGDINDGYSQPISYYKQKQKLLTSQNNIWINVSNLLREDLEGDIDSFVTNNTITGQTLSENESKWCQVDTENTFLGTGVTTGTTYYFVVDGYIEPLESQGLPNLLITGDKRYVLRNTYSRLYYKTNNLTGATYVTSTNSTPTPLTYSVTPQLNRAYIQSIRIDSSNPFDDWAEYSFGYASGATEVMRFNFYDECTYKNYDLVFKNKYGMLESLSLSKKSSKSMNVTSSDYLRSIVDLEGDFNINRHTSKQFNVSASEEWVLNTDFLPEYMNAPMKEAMLTEEMWLIETSTGNIIPIVKVDERIDFKTSLNEKLIQYSIRVKLSHNTVKNII